MGPLRVADDVWPCARFEPVLGCVRRIICERVGSRQEPPETNRRGKTNGRIVFLSALSADKMGDMAVGKTFQGVEFAPVVPTDFDQFVTDVEGKFDQLGAGYPPPAGAPPPSVDAIAGLIAVGSAAEMLVCLMQWRDGGFHVKEFEIHNSETLLADAAAAGGGQPFVIGHDLDGGLLLMAPNDGALFTAEPGAELSPIGLDLSQYLGVFRNELAMNKLEWADGWVSTA